MSNINSIHFHPTGNYLACATDYTGHLQDPTIYVYDIRQVRCLFQINSLRTNMNSIRFSNDGHHFVTGGSDMLTYVWKTNFYNYEREKKIEEKEKFCLTEKNFKEETLLGGA